MGDKAYDPHPNHTTHSCLSGEEEEEGGEVFS